MPRLLLTRPRPQAEGFAAELRARTALEPLISPMLEIRDLPVEIDLAGITSLAFTSKNGVEAFAKLSPIRLPAYCVGEATATCARGLGFEAISAGGDVQSLQKILPKTGVMHLHGKHVSGSLGVQHLAIYDQVALPLSNEAKAMLLAGEIAAVALFSPRSARLFADSFPQKAIRKPALYALSVAVAEPLLPLGTPHICATPSAKSMLRLLFADYPA